MSKSQFCQLIKRAVLPQRKTCITGGSDHLPCAYFPNEFRLLFHATGGMIVAAAGRRGTGYYPKKERKRWAEDASHADNRMAAFSGKRR